MNWALVGANTIAARYTTRTIRAQNGGGVFANNHTPRASGSHRTLRDLTASTRVNAATAG